MRTQIILRNGEEQVQDDAAPFVNVDGREIHLVDAANMVYDGKFDFDAVRRVVFNLFDSLFDPPGQFTTQPEMKLERCTKCQDRSGLDGLGKRCKACAGSGSTGRVATGRHYLLRGAGRVAIIDDPASAAGIVATLNDFPKVEATSAFYKIAEGVKEGTPLELIQAAIELTGLDDDHEDPPSRRILRHVIEQGKRADEARALVAHVIAAADVMLKYVENEVAYGPEHPAFKQLEAAVSEADTMSPPLYRNAAQVRTALEGVSTMIQSGVLKQFEGEPWVERVIEALK